MSSKSTRLVLTSTGIVATALAFYYLGYKYGSQKRSVNEYKEESHYTSKTKKSSDGETEDIDTPELPLRMIRKAETVILKRTSRVIVVVERCVNDHNYSAILRTCEALGIQTVYLIDPVINLGDQPSSVDGSDLNPNWNNTKREEKGVDMKDKVLKRISEGDLQARNTHHIFAQKATQWLTLKEFTTTSECIKALRQERRSIWVTDLSQHATSITAETLPSNFPKNVALVFGTEAVGCSNEMLEAADLRIYLPLFGFADSLNLSVSTALVVQAIFQLYPFAIGDMSEHHRQELREKWFVKLASQRLYTTGQKRSRAKLVSFLVATDEIQRKKDAKGSLTEAQEEKLMKAVQVRKQLQEMDDEIHSKAHDLMKKHIENPPPPLKDMRRADEHRSCFVGKNTKAKNREFWKDMPATSKYGVAGKKLNSAFIESDEV